MFNGREIGKILCSCGGEVQEVEPTKEEDDRFNCPRGCCLEVYQCGKCSVRWVFDLLAPDPDWERE